MDSIKQGPYLSGSYFFVCGDSYTLKNLQHGFQKHRDNGMMLNISATVRRSQNRRQLADIGIKQDTAEKAARRPRKGILRDISTLGCRGYEPRISTDCRCTTDISMQPLLQSGIQIPHNIITEGFKVFLIFKQVFIFFIRTYSRCISM